MNFSTLFAHMPKVLVVYTVLCIAYFLITRTLISKATGSKTLWVICCAASVVTTIYLETFL